MASELFHDLYDRAIRREHPKLCTVSAMLKVFGDDCDVASASRAATLLLGAGDDFEERLRMVANSNRMRVAKVAFRCLVCGQPTCPCAVAVVQLTPDQHAMLQHLLQGGSPYEYE